MAVPDAVLSALERRKELDSSTSARIKSERVAPGDIRVVHGLPHLAAEPRLGMLMGVDEANEFVEILLVHTAPELACEGDVIVPKSAASSPYDIVVQTDLRAVVWTLQLGTSVGHLEQTTMGAFKSFVLGHGSNSSSHHAVGLATGTPIAGTADLRWSFKSAEGEALRDLASDCTSALLDRGVVWQLNPDLLRPDLIDQAPTSDDIIQELVHWAMTRRLMISDADLFSLADEGALVVDRWSSISDIGSDVWISLQDILIGAATGEHREGQAVRHLVTARYLARVDETAFETVHVIGGRRWSGGD